MTFEIRNITTMKLFLKTFLLFLLLNGIANGQKLLSLACFGDCVIHLTTFNGNIKISDLVQKFVSANPNSIGTFTNTTNARIPIEPSIRFNEICSVNLLINSESIEW